MTRPARRLNVDEVAVERLVAGRWDHDRARPRPDDIAAALQLLVARETSTREIGRRLGVHERQIARWRDELAAGRELLLGHAGRTRRAA